LEAILYDDELDASSKFDGEDATSSPPQVVEANEQRRSSKTCEIYQQVEYIELNNIECYKDVLIFQAP
jgi:hypothetical protein